MTRNRQEPIRTHQELTITVILVGSWWVLIGSWLVLVVDQNVLLSNKIRGFFYHQYICNEKINALHFLHGESNEGKIGF